MSKQNLQDLTLIEVVEIATGAMNEQNCQEPVRGENPTELARWQERLLPFMSGAIILLSLAFFIASFLQLASLQQSILDSPQISVNVDLLNQAANQTAADLRSAAQIQIASNLETYILQRRYHQANVLLMSRVWINYLGFVTGMILATVGAFFVLGKLREPQTEVNAKMSWMEFAIKSGSPGLVLVVLGTALMMTTIIIHHEITVTDRSTYVPFATNELSSTHEPTPPELTMPSGNAPTADVPIAEPLPTDQPSQ